ncbi:hypothetical protein EB796_024744 [Bugula neritina]|uniref:Uncharacterized protein n=1 Tax=Bugula neritina TaxID=10212 RepID=A0A7J7ISZ0_BUGNE|nr:hypothetical protein EB796_024744 [Bugula neritina]
MLTVVVLTERICFAPPILNTEEAVICNLDTTILVSDLEEVSMSRLHKLHQCKAHMENPVLFKVTCNILPSFVCEEIPLEQGRDHGIGRRSLRVTLQDEQNRENILLLQYCLKICNSYVYGETRKRSISHVCLISFRYARSQSKLLK